MKNLFGRRKIYSVADEITAENVQFEVNKALTEHFKNIREEDYLYWYRRGDQPILARVKEIRSEINNKIVQNVASEIVAFKNGYFLTKPTFYVGRKAGMASKLKKLNDYLYLSGKHDADNSIVDWAHTTGLGALYVESSDDIDTPVKAYSVNPMKTFCTYSRKPSEEPTMGVNIVATGIKDKSGSEEYRFDVFTRDKIYRLSGQVETKTSNNRPLQAQATSLESVEANVLGEIPIIEYSYDRNRMGAFEAVLPLLDALNDIQSNREDGIAQFIQSLMIFYNCQLGEDEEGNTVTPAYIRESGAIFLKSVGQDRADLKILSEQLDQIQTQTLVDDLLKQIYDIAGVPMTSNTQGGTSDNVGAVYLRSGWGTADTMARNTEDLYRESDRRFTKIFLKILETKSLVEGIKASDIDIQFTRNEMDNLLVKTQGALNLMSLGLAPEIVLARSGVSNDPIKDIALSKGYIENVFKTKEDSDAEAEKQLMIAQQKASEDSDDGNKTNEGSNLGNREDIE